MVTAQLVQVTLVGALVWAFFVVFGSVAISLPVQDAWLGGLAPVETLVGLGSDHAVTRQLLRVATFLGGFAGFYATVYAASDNVYREHFVERITSTLERALAVRRAYLAIGVATASRCPSRSRPGRPSSGRSRPDLRHRCPGGARLRFGRHRPR